MNPHTTFRAELVRQLELLVKPQEAGELLVGLPYVETKLDVLGEFLDYYTDDLLKYQPFAEEFLPFEIEGLRSLLDVFHAAMQKEIAWPETRFQSELLLGLLRQRKA